MMPRHTISVPEAYLLNLYGSLKIRPSVLSVTLLRMRINTFIEQTGLLLTNYSHKSLILEYPIHFDQILNCLVLSGRQQATLA